MKMNLQLKVISAGLLIFFGVSAHAQKRPQDKFNNFLKQQWLIGIDVGSNVTQAIPMERYSGISNPGNEDMYDKNYRNFSSAGIQAGFYLTFYMKGLSIATQPTFQRMNFVYENEYQWGESGNPESIIFTYDIEQQLEYFHLPLMFKYDILKKKFKPYAFAGAYLNFLMGATKKVSIEKQDFQDGTGSTEPSGDIFLGVDQSFQNTHAGLLGGFGVAYDTESNVRMVIEVTYRETINNIVNPNERYTENQLTSVGDIYDDIRLRNIGLSVQFLFPLKYISSQFKSL